MEKEEREKKKREKRNERIGRNGRNEKNDRMFLSVLRSYQPVLSSVAYLVIEGTDRNLRQI